MRKSSLPLGSALMQFLAWGMFFAGGVRWTCTDSHARGWVSSTIFWYTQGQGCICGNMDRGASQSGDACSHQTDSESEEGCGGKCCVVEPLFGSADERVLLTRPSDDRVFWTGSSLSLIPVKEPDVHACILRQGDVPERASVPGVCSSAQEWCAWISVWKC